MKAKQIGASLLLTLAALLVAASAESCTNKTDAQIASLVEALNSPAMQEAEKQTGLFTGSEASVDADSLIIMFNLEPELSLSGVDESQLPALKQSAMADFKMHTASDAAFAKGVDALAANNMELVLKWRDSTGRIVRIAIPAKEL